MDLALKLRHPQCSAPATQPKVVLCHREHLLAVSIPNLTQTAHALWDWWGKNCGRKGRRRD